MASTSPSPRRAAPVTHTGTVLREWRTARRMSQLALALEAGISTRHLSYLESGKAQPSREMVTRLAEALGMPLREHNALLVAAGYAPMFAETGLETPVLAPMRAAIDLILAHQEPYPAFVVNRYWDVLLTNGAATRLFVWLRGGVVHPNILRQVFDPEDVRPALVNWEEVAGDLIRHLHQEMAATPPDTKLRTLLDEVLRYPQVPSEWRTRELGAAPAPVLTVVFRKDDRQVRFFSTITTFGTPRDVTLAELHIECFFPADEATAALCRGLAAEG